MIEEGLIVKTKDEEKALVELKRKSSCRVCRACSVDGHGRMNIKADNKLGAREGDRVKINIKANGIILGVILLYLLPALGLTVGIIIGKMLSGQGHYGIFIGIILMSLCFVLARFYGRNKVSYSAEVIEIIE